MQQLIKDILIYFIHIIKDTLIYFKPNLIAFSALIISIISLCITWKKNIKDRCYADDKELLEQLKQSLELIYKSLVIKSDNNSSLTNDRLCWITSARHIVRYCHLRKSLKTELYKTICDEQEEYWRSKVCKLLYLIQDSSFYKNQSNQEGIDPKSAAIVHAFSAWKEEIADPINEINFEEMVSKYDLFSLCHRPFRIYVEEMFPKLAEKVKKKSS